jgi:hypothetical protein
LACIFSKDYQRCAALEKAVSGSAYTGLWPFNDAIFADDEFAARKLTDEAIPVEIGGDLPAEHQLGI